MSDYGGPPAYGGPQGYEHGGEPPSNNLVWGILATIFCCLPLGIVSIVFAAQVNSKWAAGDYAGARESARRARQWAIFSAAAGLLAVMLYVVLLGAGVSLGPQRDTTGV